MKAFEVHSGLFGSIDWTVLSIVGEEAISELFQFVIHVEARQDDLAAAAGHGTLDAIDRALVGQRVLFRLRHDAPARYGIVASVQAEATNESGGETWTRLAVEVVPRAWLLLQRRNSRIFQHVWVFNIVSYVLNESGVSHRFRLMRSYPQRLYCTQYDETDWEFVTRLLAEEGILFYFEHDADFAGGPVPEPPSETSGWDTAAKVLGGVSSVAGVVGGMGDNMALDTVSFLASGGNVLADLVKPVVDEEADKPSKLSLGDAGPRGWAYMHGNEKGAAVGGTDVLTFIDQPPYSPILARDDPNRVAELRLVESGGTEGDEDALTEMLPARRLRAKHTTVRDFDFRRPMLLLEAEKEAEVDVPGDAPLEVYAHHGEYEKPDVTDDVARVRLEQERADVATLEGRGHCHRLVAGGYFTLKNAHAAHVQDRDLAVVRVRHELHAPREHAAHRDGEHARTESLARGCARAIHDALLRREPIAEEALLSTILAELGPERALVPRRTYKNSFTCVPTRITYRPPRPPPLVRNAVESAIVVGPRGLPPPAPGPPDPNDPTSGDAAKEIYTDRYGRVKVQFHWDREGELDEHSSCWVRVAQTWAGAGFGFQFIPRVGMEVLVGFLRGDPDRPVILGTVYNATHALPEPVPQRSTRSGIRTQTSPGGGGFNELSFEDARGVERVSLHAQKDLEETVNDTHTLNVKNVQKVIVGTRQETEVGGDRLAFVAGNQSTVVGGHEAAHVRGNRTVNVVMSETVVVGGNATRSVDGLSVETVKSDRLTVVEGDHNLAVLGTSITQIGGKDADTKTAAITYVQGKSFHTSSDGALIKVEKPKKGAGGTLRLECGDSFIEIGPDKITLSAKTIEGTGSDKLDIGSKGSRFTADKDSANLNSKAASLSTPDGSKMGVDGSQASIVAPGTAKTKAGKVDFEKSGGSGDKKDEKKDDKPAGQSLTLRFFHGGGAVKPIGGTKYRVVIDDRVFDGETSGSEDLTISPLPAGAKVAFVTLWANVVYPTLYPNGPLQWLVHLVPDVDIATSTKGARMRLRNLGYEPGTKVDADALDDPTRQALLEFQIDRDVPPAGELDHITQKKLFDTYGS